MVVQPRPHAAAPYVGRVLAGLHHQFGCHRVRVLLRRHHPNRGLRPEQAEAVPGQVWVPPAGVRGAVRGVLRALHPEVPRNLQLLLLRGGGDLRLRLLARGRARAEYLRVQRAVAGGGGHPGGAGAAAGDRGGSLGDGGKRGLDGAPEPRAGGGDLLPGVDDHAVLHHHRARHRADHVRRAGGRQRDGVRVLRGEPARAAQRPPESLPQASQGVAVHGQDGARARRRGEVRGDQR
mmetsp:Transcript_20811/g.42665  ORF Transcript_20811/g.42665 Transcript_20811/m.42665 type:complete len:235 (+) Transcript_20811:972-1676(+)